MVQSAKVSTSARLRQIMDERGLRQVDVLEMAQPYCEEYNVKLSKSALSQFLSGRNEPKQDKLLILAMALDVSEAWLMGLDVPKERTTRPMSPESDPKLRQIAKLSRGLTEDQKDEVLALLIKCLQERRIDDLSRRLKAQREES